MAELPVARWKHDDAQDGYALRDQFGKEYAFMADEYALGMPDRRYRLFVQRLNISIAVNAALEEEHKQDG